MGPIFEMSQNVKFVVFYNICKNPIVLGHLAAFPPPWSAMVDVVAVVLLCFEYGGKSMRHVARVASMRWRVPILERHHEADIAVATDDSPCEEIPGALRGDFYLTVQPVDFGLLMSYDAGSGSGSNFNGWPKMTGASDRRSSCTSTSYWQNIRVMGA